MMANVCSDTNAKEIWKTIRDVFEKHIIYTKLIARYCFCTSRKHESERVLAFASRIRQLVKILKSMKVIINDERWLRKI